MIRSLTPFLFALTVAALPGCGGSADDAMPSGALAMHLDYQSGTAGDRTFRVTSLASLRTDRRETYLCHIGTFDASGSQYRPTVVELFVRGAIQQPFGDAQFFERNGTFGYVCAKLDDERVEEVKACLATEGSQCASVTEAEARIGERLRATGFDMPVLD